jgi:hypothetical protein
MIRTPYARRRLARALATVAAALGLMVPLAGCEQLSPSEGPSGTATPTPTETDTATSTATSTPTPSDDATPLGPLSGAWEGTWINTTPEPAIGTFTLVWAQQDDRLFGALTVTGSNCLSAGNVTGEIVGKGLSFGAVEGDTTIEYTGTIVDDDTIEGTYESDCGDSAGTWTATRTRT